jgi:predicted nucleic acid-binding protein
MTVPIAILDTGIIVLYLSANPHQKILELIENIKKQNIYAKTTPSVLSEAFKHICIKKGKAHAKISLVSFQSEVPIEIESISNQLAFEAGSIKCQYRDQLSYTDCTLIALAVYNKGTLHTTEKSLPDISKLKIETYIF